MTPDEIYRLDRISASLDAHPTMHLNHDDAQWLATMLRDCLENHA